MPPRPIHPAIRYADVAPIWAAAIRDDGTHIDTINRSEAVTLSHRINAYRKAMRGLSPSGMILEDSFTVRLINNEDGTGVQIAPRATFDPQRLCKLDGTPASVPTPTQTEPDQTPLTEEERRILEQAQVELRKRGLSLE